MRLILQRVKWARVMIRDQVAGEIEEGLMVLAGFSAADVELAGTRVWKVMQDKLMGLRIFADNQGKFNLSVEDIQGKILLVPQFTLYADCRKGRRPGFTGSAPYDQARALFDRFAGELKERWPGVELGVFGAEMQVELNNSGPVTIILDSDDFQ
ncbi:MAG: D-aminoacyl-tRNA deacylase [Desulfonatronovibrio sp.]